MNSATLSMGFIPTLYHADVQADSKLISSVQNFQIDRNAHATVDRKGSEYFETARYILNNHAGTELTAETVL